MAQRIVFKGIVFSLFCFSFLSLSAHADDEMGWYTVVKGDTLSFIAVTKVEKTPNSHESRLHRLIRWNPQIKNPDRIYPNDRVRIGFGFDEDDHGQVKRKQHEKSSDTSDDETSSESNE